MQRSRADSAIRRSPSHAGSCLTIPRCPACHRRTGYPSSASNCSCLGEHRNGPALASSVPPPAPRASGCRASGRRGGGGTRSSSELRNIAAAASRVVFPPASSRAICSSCGVSSSIVLGSRRRSVSPVAASSARARSVQGRASSSSNVSSARAELLARQLAVARASQSLSVCELRACRLERVGRVGVLLEGLLEQRGESMRPRRRDRWPRSARAIDHG